MCLQKTESVPGKAVFIDTASLRMAELTSKASVTGPMRALISIFYPPERLAASSANKGINSTIRTANFGKDTHAGAPNCFTSCISQ